MRGFTLTVATILFVVIVALAVRPGDGPVQQGEYHPLGEAVFPEDLSELVASSSAIVVGRHIDSADLGFTELATPVATPMYPAPAMGVYLVGASVVVDSVLKNDGAITTTQVITYGVPGKYPIGNAALATDSVSELPVVWETDTEFILFLDTPEGSSIYYLPYSECSRLLASSTDVTCSDGSRSALGFMTGKSKAQFIAEIESEVANPAPTPTYLPTYTPFPTDTPTPTPGSGP